MESSAGNQQFIGGLRTLAVLCVILVSAAPYAQIGDSGALQAVVDALQTVAFPLLFACEGFMATMPGKPWRTLFGQGIRELLVPWVAFTALYSALRLLFELIGALPEHLVLAGNGNLLTFMYRSEAAPALVVLPALFLLRLLRPLGQAIVRLSPVYAIAFAVCAAVLFQHQHNRLQDLLGPMPGPLLYAAWGLPFFASGIVFARCRRWLVRFWPFVVVPLFGVYGYAWFPGGMLFAGIGYQYLLIAALFILFMGALDRPFVLHRFGRLALPVIALHAPVLVKGIQTALEMWQLSAAASWAGLGVLTVGIAFFSAHVLDIIPGGRWLIGTPRPVDEPGPQGRTETS